MDYPNNSGEVKETKEGEQIVEKTQGIYRVMGVSCGEREDELAKILGFIKDNSETDIGDFR